MNFRKLFLFGVLFIAFVFSVNAQTVTEKPQLKPATENRYRLNPGDVLEIVYRYTPEFNQSVAIQPDGFVVLEIVGELELGGLTVEQARQNILKNAAKRLKDPEVTLLLKEFQKPYFVVSGEVPQPGRFQLNENITALQAIMLAGGFKDTAKQSQVIVFRKINSDTAEVRVLSLKNIKKTSDLENDFALESGDMLLVPRNTITKVERYVNLLNLPSFIGPLLNPIMQKSPTRRN